MISTVAFWRLTFVISASVLAFFIVASDSYWAIYGAMFFFLFCATKNSGITNRFLSYFLMIYLGFALLDISNYRGSIDIQTLN